MQCLLRLLTRALRALPAAVLSLAAVDASAQWQIPGFNNDVVLDARAAWAKRDRQRLAAARASVMAAPDAARHPLASWVEYWELNNRLTDATTDEVGAFYSRWPGSYVEDRLRNDWLLELGRRRDWPALAADYPRFRMNDDREVSCYALLADHVAGRDVRERARAAWLAQRDADDGCSLLAQTLFDARVLERADVWVKLRASVEAGRLRAAQRAAMLLGDGVAAAVGELSDDAARYLSRKASAKPRDNAELAALAIARMAANDAEAAAGMLERRWQRALPAELAGWAWAQTARQAALSLSPDAAAWYRRAEKLAGASAASWSDDVRAWQARSALRAPNGSDWPQVLAAIDALGESERPDPTWQYWKARALKATAGDGAAGAPKRAEGHALLMAIAEQQRHFYGKLAAEDLGEPLLLPPAPAPLTPAERVAAVKHPGLDRALTLIAIGLRNEGVREWNFSLRGMAERELLAAAQLACEREVWDRCINTSDRTRAEIDMAQRYPMPFRAEVTATAREAGLDPAAVYGLIRQESRFIADTRSHVGASGLMQLMPATARWTARRIGLPYTQDAINERDVNLKLGSAYLKLVLDDFGGSLPLAAAAYNAGPSRPRKWRDGPLLEPAAWAENIPFGETRDYVKKVLSNAVDYAALLGQPASLKARLGRAIGPRDTAAAGPDAELP